MKTPVLRSSIVALLVAVAGQAQSSQALRACTPVDRAGIQSGSRLVFHHYGNIYVLSQIWTSGDTRGREAPVSSRERELASIQRTPDETIILAMR